MDILAPGFRFCPTDEELVTWYLRPKALGKQFPQGTIAEVDIYKYEPWDLPDKSALSTKDPEWYFFSTRDKSYSHNARTKRTTSKGFWKATGKDRKVTSSGCIVGWKKTLIFYEGRAPKGCRTNWLMHEYRLDQESEGRVKGMNVSVVCRIRKKGGRGPRNGEQYGALVCNESGEANDDDDDGESKSGDMTPYNDPGALDEDNVEQGGNAFNLQNQVKQLMPQQNSLVQVASIKTNTEGNFLVGTTDGAFSWCSDNNHGIDTVPAASGNTTGKSNPTGESPFYLDTPYPNVGFGYREDPVIWDQFHGLSDHSALDNHNLSFIDSKEITSGTGAQHLGSSVFSGYGQHAVSGNYVELDDLEELLLIDPSQSSIPVHAFSECDFSSREIVQDPLTLEESATLLEQYVGTSRLQPQVPTHCYGASDGIILPITGHSEKEAIGLRHGSCVNSCTISDTKDSSTKSYLSRHMSTYSVSKCEVAPPQMSYASLLHDYNHYTELNKKMFSAVLPSDHKQQLEKLPVESCSASVMGAQHASDELCKKTDSLKACLNGDENSNKGKKSTCSVDVCVPPRQSTVSCAVEENEPVGVALLAFVPCQTSHEGGRPRKQNVVMPCDVDVEPLIIDSSKRQRVRNWLKNKLKQSAFGVKFIQLEEGMRSKLNDRFFFHTKPAVDLYETKDDEDFLHKLKCYIMLILYCLLSAGLILSCLVWGYHAATLYVASYVSVQ